MPLPALGRRAVLSAAAALGLARMPPALAAPLPKPDGRAILSVTGKIGRTNDGKAARFDVTLLESLGRASFSTATPWYDRPMAFEGVPLQSVLQAVAAQGETIRAVALNDYASDLPVADFARFDTLLALKIDGKYLAISDKGPCFIIYPFDRFPELHNAKYYSRSVWQVSQVVVL